MKTLDEIAHEQTDPKLWTDKRTGDGHGYTDIYEKYFSPLRESPLRILEIGVNMGASVIMWLDYFPNCRVVGFDLEDRGRPVNDRYVFVKGDQSNVDHISELAMGHAPFDIIIDDGSHASKDIEISHLALWHFIRRGGFYCIEDIGEMYTPDRLSPGYGDHLHFLRSLMDRINRGRGDMEYLHFYKELAIMKKK